MERFTFFWRSASPFSQWHPCTFVVDGVTYGTAEQYMMHGKALLFGDHAIAELILGTNDPREQKALGRRVAGFDQEVWTRECRGIVYRGNHAKFTQNPELRAALLATAGTTIVEASPLDRIWGIGLGENHPDATNRSKWRGRNWLGEVLTQLREDLTAGRGGVGSGNSMEP